MGEQARGGRYEEVRDLIDYFSKNTYRAREGVGKVDEIQVRCLELFSRDYVCAWLENAGGELCGHYPLHVALLEYETHAGRHNERFESVLEVQRLRELVTKSKMARCRGRFVCPVILYGGKHICRSSTLAGWGEIYGRSSYNYLFSTGGVDDGGGGGGGGGGVDGDGGVGGVGSNDEAWLRNGRESQLFNRIRGNDIKLLKHLGVRFICDLMVENKKVKFGMNVTSSEKVDKAQRYADFTLLSLPYPGCEFFKAYRERDYSGEGLVFDWSQDYVDAPLSVPEELREGLPINWGGYRSWDLMEQTQNYLRLLLHIINLDDESGLLVHCISGWDRTPLFISLLRLSLWADGLVHASLGPEEILYLTIAYDWFLFGHMLEDRLLKGEEIFFFCFNCLKHISGDEFSALRRKRRKRESSRETEGRSDDGGALDGRLAGSSSSLNSVGSLSTLLDDSPSVLTESGDPHAHPLARSHHCAETRSHLLHQSEDRMAAHPNQSEHGLLQQRGSSPLAVPTRERWGRVAGTGSVASSCESESWQLVSDSGSLRGPARGMGRDSPFPHQLPGPSPRQVRLEEVRSVFLAAYSLTVGLRSPPGPPTPSLTGLLEHLVRGLRT
ncbi:phosphatidylinositol-3,5-bisphosphate 3-phosphatase MTMR14 [Lampetra fluviatilis]